MRVIVETCIDRALWLHYPRSLAPKVNVLTFK